MKKSTASNQAVRRRPARIIPSSGLAGIAGGIDSLLDSKAQSYSDLSSKLQITLPEANNTRS